jgi:hypothetical protein
MDNDGDGKIDWPEDPGCSDALDEYEDDIAGNQPPIAHIDLSRDHGAPGMTINVDGSDSYDPDTDGSIVSYAWHITGPESYLYDASNTGAPGSFDMLFYNIGTYTITLTVTDNEGASDDVVATVTIGSGFAECNDGIDNDNDGYVDWPADPHCFSQDYDRESAVLPAFGTFVDRDDLLITRITTDGEDVESALGEPGSQMRVTVEVENNLDYTLEDVKLQVSVDELTLRETDKIGDLEDGENAAARVVMDLPYDIAPGLYDLRIVVSNDDIRRVKYRQILIV